MDIVTAERMGYKVPPYRLACMSKSVAKIDVSDAGSV